MWPKNATLEEIPSMFPYSISKSLSNAMGERFFERLKWICKLFKIDEKKGFKKPVLFLKSSKHLYSIICTGKLILINLAEFLGSGILCFITEL